MTNWDKISFGKCKHAYLLIDYAKDKNIDESEIKAEEWAKRSMRILADLSDEQKQAALENEINDLSAKNKLF